MQVGNIKNTSFGLSPRLKRLRAKREACAMLRSILQELPSESSYEKALRAKRLEEANTRINILSVFFDGISKILG